MMILKLAWRNLWRNKRRTLITSSAVFFAAFLSIAMNSIQDGMHKQMIQNVVGYYSGYVQIHQDGYWDEQTIDNTFTVEEQVQKVANDHPSVERSVPRLESFALAIAEDVSRPAMVVGVDPELEDQFTKLQAKLIKGDYFAPNGQEVIVAQGLTEKLKIGLGDTIILLGQGYHGVTAAGKYPITGIMKLGSPELNSRLVYLPLQAAQEMYGAPELLTSLALDINTPDKSEQVAQKLQEDLPEGYEVMDWKSMMPELVQLLEADKGGNVIMLGILYLVVGFGIFGTVLMMTAERKYEFGVLIGIGMKKIKLAATVLLETIFISLIGVLAGSFFAFPLVAFFHYSPVYLEGLKEAYEQYGFEPVLMTSIDLGIFVNQAIIVLVISCLISIYPAFRIMKIDPVKAMHV